MNNDLLFLSGNDIPFIEAQITIHNPTLKEIGLIGEEVFFTGCEILNFSKNLLAEEDKIHLKDKSDFDILIAILEERKAVMQKNRNCVEMVLALLFPNYHILITSNAIVLSNDIENHSIDNSNYDAFKNIISEMFSLKDNENNKDFNPDGQMAKSIADKLRKRHQKLAELKSEKQKKVSIISRYVSILAVGEKKNMNELLQYNLYQLYDEFKRFQLKVGYDIVIKARLAGAKDIKDAEDWMEDIHS